MSKTEKEQAADVIEALSGFVTALMRGAPAQVAPPKIEVREMKAELAGTSSAQPVSYADEFGAAEEIARLRRGRDGARVEAQSLGRTIDRVRTALGGPPIEQLDEVATAQRREPLELRKSATSLIGERDAAAQTAEANWREVTRERDEARAGLEKAAAQAEPLKEEQEAVREALGLAVPPSEGLPAAAALLASHRDALLEQVEAAEKKVRAFPGAEAEELREECARLRRSRDIVTADLTDLCELISDGEHSSYVLASERVKETRSRLSALQDWQTSISAALECSPANIHDRVRTLQAELKELRAQRKPDSVVGDE